MEKIGESKPRGISAAALRAWGMVFLAAGVISRGVLQNRLLGLGNVSNQQLLELLNSDPSLMTASAAALILQALEGCAVPIFALLLVEGFIHTKDWKKYLIRVAAAAVISEIPFDLAMSGSVLDLTSQNPGFAMALGLVILFFFNRFGESSGTNRFIKAIVVAAAIIWAEMLRIQHGTAFVVLICVFWLIQKKPQLRGLVGAGICMACTVISPYYIIAAMGCMVVHMYNGQQGTSSRVTNYALYPVLLLAIWLAASFAF